MSDPWICEFDRLFRLEDPAEFCIRIRVAEELLPLPREGFGNLYEPSYDFVSDTIVLGNVTDKFGLNIRLHSWGIGAISVRCLKKSGAYLPVSCDVSRLYDDPAKLTYNYRLKYWERSHPFSWDTPELEGNDRSIDFDELFIRIRLKQKEMESGDKNAEFLMDDQPTLPPGTFDCFLLSSQFSDIQILTMGGTTFPCHRLMLTARSPVFGRMLQYTEEKLDLSDISPLVMKKFLRYIYTNKCDCLAGNNLDVLIELFLTADRFMMDDLKGLCVEVITSKVTEEYAVELWNMAKHFQLLQLQTEIKNFCYKNRQLIFVEGSQVRDLAKLCFPTMMCLPIRKCSLCN